MPPARHVGTIQAAPRSPRNPPRATSSVVGTLARRAGHASGGATVRGHQMTFLWFIAWIITNSFIADSPIQFDPVNVWSTLLLLAIAIDLAGAQAKGWSKR